MEYVKIPPNRFNDVILHLRNTFFADEPLNHSVSLCKTGEPHVELEKHSMSTLEDGLSIMAVTEENEIAGVVLNGYLLEGDIESAIASLSDNKDEGFKKIFNLLYSSNQKMDLFNRFKVDKIFEIRILSVDSKFRGKGIAKELVKQSEMVAEEKEFKTLKTDATGVFSQKIFSSLGYNTISEVQYNSLLDNDNTQIFNVTEPHTSLKIMIKELP